MTDARNIYQQADREIAHLRRLLAGSLSPRQRRAARLRLIRAHAASFRARLILEQRQESEVCDEMVAV